MNLGLGLGLARGRRPAISGVIPPTTPPGGGGGGGGGGFEGHENPPTVEVVQDTVVIRGKTKAGFVGRIVVPLGALVAGRTYDVNVVADLSGLALDGAKAGIGFGFKTGNDFRLELLQGNAGSTRLVTITGSPPTNGWNKETGHTVAAHGAPTNGTQHAMDIQMAVNEAGDAYTFSTSGDGQETWDQELADQSFAPFADISGIDSGAAIAAYFSSDDFGSYTITVAWVEQDLVLWTPEEIATLLWLDADDAATFTFGTGANIAQWDDKSGNANHFSQGTAGVRPERDTVTNTIGGLPVVSFASGDFLAKDTLSGWPANNGTAATCVVVARKRGAFGAIGALWDISTGTLTNTTALAFHGVDPTPGMNLRCTIIGNGAASSAGSINNNPAMWSFTVKSDKREIFKNGAVDGTNLVDNGTSAHTNMRIGLLFQDVAPWIGDHAEHVWVTGDDDNTRQLIEGYMAWKWGLEGDLDAGHPYKASPPTV